MKVNKTILKRICSFFMVITFVLSSLYISFLDENVTSAKKLNNGTTIYITVNGKKISKKKSAARKIGTQYLVNAKVISKSIKAKHSFKKNVVTIKKKNRVLKFNLNSKVYFVGKKKKKSAISTRKISGQIFVDAKIVAKTFNYPKVSFNKKTSTLSITTKSYKPPVNNNIDVNIQPNPTTTPTNSPPTNNGNSTPILSTGDRYTTVAFESFEKGDFNLKSNVVGSYSQNSDGCNDSLGSIKVDSNALSYKFNTKLIRGTKYLLSMYVKGAINNVCITNNSTPTIDLINTDCSNWTLVNATFYGESSLIGSKLTLKVDGTAGEYFIDDIKISKFVGKGEGAEENYSNPLTRVRINAPNYYMIEELGIKDSNLDATIVIEDGTTSHNMLLEETEIVLNGRGNSTFYEAGTKRPLTFKFKNGSKAIGDMPKGKKWNLLAEYFDRTLMRNSIVQNFAANLSGLDYAPKTKLVEVYVNDTYIGVYLLTEAIQVSKERLNIDDKPNDEDFGFLIEWDMRAKDEAQQRYDEIEDKTNVSSPKDTYFELNIDGQNITFVYKSPDCEDMTPSQRNYIKNTVANASKAILKSKSGNTQYLDYCDIDSFVDYFIVNDFCQNYDAVNFSSIYLHKDKGGKLKMGPCWDYDIYVGNGKNKPDSKCLEWGNPWFSKLVYNGTFASKLSKRWDEIKNTVVKDCLIGQIDVLTPILESAATRNFNIWDVQKNDVFVGQIQRPLTGSWKNEIKYLKDWLQLRIKYGDENY